MDFYPPQLDSPYSPGTWKQPPRERFLIDEIHVICTKSDFESLLDYSGSMPSGVYPGKMWRRQDGIYDPNCKSPEWLLMWYGPTENPDKCSINFRKVLFI